MQSHAIALFNDSGPQKGNLYIEKEDTIPLRDCCLRLQAHWISIWQSYFRFICTMELYRYLTFRSPPI